MQAVRESKQRGKLKRNLKKIEKSSWQILEDVLTYNSCLMNGAEPGGQRSQLKIRLEHFKKVLRNLKKYLTNEISCDNI